MKPADTIPNPFVYGQILLPGKPFCSRPELEASVLEAAGSQQRIVLLGERRMGKSSLVEHTLDGAERILVPVDLRGLDSMADFIDRLLLKLSTKLEAHRLLLKHLPVALKEALSFIAEVNVNLHGILQVSARAKPKASTVIRAMDAVERASRWRPLVIFFDEFQDIVENLEEREARHLLGVLRGEIQRHSRVAYLFAGSARGSMLELFTAERSHFYQSATVLEVGPIPQGAMAEFLSGQFARGKREIRPDTLQAIFALAGESPNDQQQLAYHLWTQSIPGRLGLEELQRAFSALMAEVSRRGEIILEGATPAQRRVLFAVALRENEETATDSFIRFSGFNTNSSVVSAMRPFLKGNNALLEKRGSRVRYRERFMRLWVLLQVVKTPSIFPAGRAFTADSEQGLLLPYLSNALRGS
jgi:AAA+ ATPase superfamily predicted ATPase